MSYYFSAIPEDMAKSLPVNPKDYNAYLTLNLLRYSEADEKIEIWHSDGIVDQVAWLVREEHNSPLNSIPSHLPTDPSALLQIRFTFEENHKLLLELWEHKFTLFKTEVSRCFELYDESDDYLRLLSEYMVKNFGLEGHILHGSFEDTFGDQLSVFFAKLEKERKFRKVAKDREAIAAPKQTAGSSRQRNELDGRTQLRLLYTMKFLLNKANITTQESKALKIAEFLEFITAYDKENYRRWYNQPLRGEEKNFQDDLKYVSDKLKLLGLSLTTEEVSDGILGKR